MELHEGTSTTTTTESTYESPSFGDMLSGGFGDDAGSDPTPAVTAPEPTIPAPAPAATEAKADASQQATAVATAAATSPVPPAAPAPAFDPDLLRAEVAKATRGIVGALQAERERRQALEQQLGGSVPVSEAEAQLQAMRQQMFQQSQQLARLTYKDYDDVVAFADAECAGNQALLETILSSPNPAIAAYQTGLNLKLAKEWGPEVMGNPHLLLQKATEKAEKDIRAKLEKEFEAKLAARAADRAKTPTDISEARSAGGGSVPYVSPSFGEMLRGATKRK